LYKYHLHTSKAIDSAPREKPANVSKTIVMSSVEVHVPFMKKWKKKIKKEVKPRTAKPNPKSHYGSTTKETFKACGKLVRAAV
jgi:hypothetical protein